MEIMDLVILWNQKYKLDFIYRKRHNIRFNSREHREINPVLMCFELIENKMFIEATKPKDVKQKEEDDQLFDDMILD